MTVVVDASLMLSIVMPLPYSPQAIQLVTKWKGSGEMMRAPILLEYEIVSALRKAAFLQDMSMDEAFTTLTNLLALGVQCFDPTPVLHKRALEWANFLGQSKAYDSQYLALAESIHAGFWTANRRLVRGAHQVGADWVHWVGDLNDVEDS